MTPLTPAPPLLIRGGFVYTVDENNQIHPEGSVLATNGRIAAVGSVAEVAGACQRLDPTSRAELRTLDANGAMVLPGFVNPHWHDMLAARVAFRGASRPADDRSDPPGFLSRGGDIPLISALFDRFAGMVAQLSDG